MPANQEPAPKNEGRPQGMQDPERLAAQEASAAEMPKTSEPPKSGGKTVRVVWPNNEFVVEGLPLLTREGTTVAASDVKKAQEMADLCGVDLEVDD
jgi:hypothetical protein